MKRQTLCGAAAAAPLKTVKAAPIPLSASAQQEEARPLTGARGTATGKTTGIYTQSLYACAVAYDFGMIWKQQG